jgi:hypothetical protein
MTTFLVILSRTTPSVIALAGTLAAAGACGSDAAPVGQADALPFDAPIGAAPEVDATPGDAAPLDASIGDAPRVDTSPGDAAPLDAARPSDAALTCPPLERPCPCATGAYCLPGNAACIAPTASCPDQDAAPTDASPMDATPADGGAKCPTGDKACACATGSYCVGEGSLCISPTAQCPTD